MQRINNFGVWLKQLSKTSKTLAVISADLITLLFAVLLSYSLRISAFELPETALLHLYLFAPLVTVVVVYAFGVHDFAMRSFSSALQRRLISALLVTSVLWLIYLYSFGTQGFARSVVVIYGLFAYLSMMFVRQTAASFLALEISKSNPRPPVPLFIVGAGVEGTKLVETFRTKNKYKPLLFLDDDVTLLDRKVANLKVHSLQHLKELAAQYSPEEVVFAKPGLSRAKRKEIVDLLVSQGIIAKILPSVEELQAGTEAVSAIRPVSLEDLLGRDSIPPDAALMEKAINGKVVLITGAGGSIGSELVRQCWAFSPSKIILVENSEFALFSIHRELEQSQRLGTGVAKDIVLIPVIADAGDGEFMLKLLTDHRVSIVFHAAAYKHVRLVQENVRAGIHNNILGTKAVLEAALAARVDRFVLISTDKAVRPTSVMGATKRVAEMLLQAHAQRTRSGTILSMVRFGNVLGSSGSVVPIFKQQIEHGGPITVTHPDVTRYFMLISEAAQLVIQSAAMAKGGEVFVLDMGEPVKIMSLAENMVRLAGLTVKNEVNEGDIEINFTGLQDGEKLFEELYLGESLTTTAHSRIMQCDEPVLSKSKLEATIAKGLRRKDAQWVLDLAYPANATRQK